VFPDGFTRQILVQVADGDEPVFALGIREQLRHEIGCALAGAQYE
jgi:hypothetical protein